MKVYVFTYFSLGYVCNWKFVHTFDGLVLVILFIYCGIDVHTIDLVCRGAGKGHWWRNKRDVAIVWQRPENVM